MFTGIVEEMGRVAGVSNTSKGYEMVISGKVVLEGTRLGDSISVNGVCLTVTKLTGNEFTVGVAPETRSLTNLEQLKIGDRVNLERAVTPSTRLGGHYVQGHVDGIGLISKMVPDGESLRVYFTAPEALLKYMVPKGFIALDGVSLTLVDVTKDSFSIMLVAYTQNHIVLPSKKPGERVNIEVDILGKYVEKIIGSRLGGATSGITHNLLKENGFA